MNDKNQKPEDKARDKIDNMLRASGWAVQDKNKIDFSAAVGIAVREYQTEVGPADYVLFVDKKPCGIIEAKREKEGQNLSRVEEQSRQYGEAKLKWVQDNKPLTYIHETNGKITFFTNMEDPKPRAREIFSFHRPETFKNWLKQPETLRSRLCELPELNVEGLRECQISAITNLEKSFKQNRPRALIQMATGAGKTFTAITSIYRLLKHSSAKRILFLVDTKNLGEQAEQEFMAYAPNDDNRKFTELYNVQRLKSSYIAKDSHVVICTIQRLYSILKGEELEEAAEEENPAEIIGPKKPLPVVYSEQIPIEFFDFIVIDECHRSIYNLWQQVLDYFDSFLVGLTATPDKRTFGFFKENVVSEYSHEEAVADGVNVGHDVFVIETEITKEGSKIAAKQYIEKRNKLTREKRWSQTDEDVVYTSNKLDKDIVNPSQIRNVIRAYKDKLPEIFPNRDEVPKTLIFAKTDSHADDIIRTVRDEFDESNEFCKKVTYKADEDPKSVLSQFRNDFYPRIAVTVDMIATGTDVKPLECLLFMRDVKSRNYFEQMKGRGTRTLEYDDLKRVSPSAISKKTHFVIVDAIGVTKSLKTDSRPLERKPSIPLKDLLYSVLMGAKDEDTITTLASRLARLQQQITKDEAKQIKVKAKNTPLNQIIKNLLSAVDADVIERKAKEKFGPEEYAIYDEVKKEQQHDEVKNELINQASNVFNGELNELIENIRKEHEQIIDSVNIDQVTFAGWEGQAKEKSQELVKEFSEYIEQNKDNIIALSIFYDQPYRRRELNYQMIKELFDKLKSDKPKLAPIRIWQAYAGLDEIKAQSPINELTALVSLVRRVSGIDKKVLPYPNTVRANFQKWIMKQNAGNHNKFTAEQMQWLQMIRDHVASSFHIDKDDLDLSPFDKHGGLGKMWQLFGEESDELIEELNEVLAA